MKKKARRKDDPEVIPPVMTERLTASALHQMAVKMRRAIAECAMAEILPKMKKDAQLGMMHSELCFDLEEWRAIVLIESLLEELPKHGFKAGAGRRKQNTFHGMIEQPVLLVSWREPLS